METNPAAPAAEGGTFVKRLRDFGVIFVVAVAAAMFLRTFVLEVYNIPSRSMEPALLAGDHLVVSRLFYGARIGSLLIPGWSSPDRGEVIVFELPASAGSGRGAFTFVKRCVAVPGDSIAIAGESIWVNGALVRAQTGDQSPAPAPPRTGWRIPLPGEEIQLSFDVLPLWHSLIAREGHRVEALPAGEIRIDGAPATSYRVMQSHYFVVGDNRSDSYDSRQWGLLPGSAIIGKAALIYWSGSEEGGVRWSRIGSPIR